MDKTTRPDTIVSRRWLLNAAIKTTTASCALGAAGVFAYKNINNPTLKQPETINHVTVVAGYADAPLPTSPKPISGFQMGYNMPGANYYTPTVMLNNWGKNIKIDDDGNLYIPTHAINGAVSVKTNPGVLLKRTDQSISPIISNQKLGIHTFIIIKDSVETVRRIGWSGVKPTSFEVTRYGVSGTIANEWISGVMGKWLRNLDMDQVNDVPMVDPTALTYGIQSYFYSSTPTGSVVPFQDIADGIAAVKSNNPDFVGLWDVLRVDITDEKVSQRAIYQRDNMPSDTIIALEFGNEMFWNYNFSGNVRAMLDGMRNGYYGDATENRRNPSLSIEIAHNIYSGSPTPAVSKNALIAIQNFPGEGPCIFRAVQDAPTGIEITNTSYFTKQYGYSVLMEAGKRWASVRHNQIIEIYRSVFGEDRFKSQIVPVVMGQQDRGEVAEWMSIQREFVPGYWQKVVGVGCSFYINDSGATEISPTGLGDAFRRNTRPTINKIKNVVDQVAAMGKTFMAYEGMTHPNAGNYNGDPKYRTAWDTFFDSEEGETFMADWAYLIRTTATGPVCGYMGVGPKPWSLKNNWSDTANRRFVGWNKGLNPSYSLSRNYV